MFSPGWGALLNPSGLVSRCRGLDGSLLGRGSSWSSSPRGSLSPKGVGLTEKAVAAAGLLLSLRVRMAIDGLEVKETNGFNLE